jgi:hypothetical protein
MRGVPNFSGGGTLMFVWLGLVRTTARFETASNELDAMTIWNTWRG